MDKLKQVIVVNEALNLPRGKLAAQVAHASVASLLAADSTVLQAWLNAGMPKIVLAGASEEAVISCYEQALAEKIPAYLIRDAGKTVLAAGTVTCAGIGPSSAQKIDFVTGKLKLIS